MISWTKICSLQLTGKRNRRADHPATLAVQRAAISGDGDDIGRARSLFLQLTPENQRAALTIAATTPSSVR